jgi:hypothetical protein
VVSSYIAQQAYGRLQPVVDSLIGIPSEVAFPLTRNCSSEGRALICLMKEDRFSRSLHPASQTVLERPDHMNENLLWILNFIFGCRHRKLSRPFTCSRRTYEVCLDCGRQVPYSLETMSLQWTGPSQDAANANSRYRIE